MSPIARWSGISPKSMSPPMGLETFAEVMTAYEGYAMGASERRSFMSFASESIGPDRLMTIAARANSLPRRRDSSSSPRRCSSASARRSARSQTPTRRTPSRTPSATALARQPMSRDSVALMCEENADYVRRMSDEIVGCVTSRPEQRPRSPRRYPISYGNSDGFSDGFSGRAPGAQHLSRLTPPEGCSTFAEVAWAYENYANGMGAAGRRSTLCFAQESIVQDSLQSIADKSAPSRSPRRRPNSAGSTPRQSTSSLHSSPSRPRSPRQLARTPSRERYLRNASIPISGPMHTAEVAWFTPEMQSRGVLSPESAEKQARRSHSPGQNSADTRVRRSFGANGQSEKIPARSSKLAVDFSVYRSQCGTNGQTLANCGMVRRSTNSQVSGGGGQRMDHNLDQYTPGRVSESECTTSPSQTRMLSSRASRNPTPRKIALEPCQSKSQDAMSGRPALMRLGELLDGSKNRARLC